MAKYKNKYRIEPNRWQYWDYSAPGDYFITINTENRKHLFGIIKNGVMELSKCGKIVENEFLKIDNYHRRAKLDEYIIMPDHVHCIITLLDYDYDNVIVGNDVVGGVDVGGDVGGGVGGDVEKIHEFSLPIQQQQSVIKQNRQLTIDEIKQYRKLRRNMILIKILGKFQQQTSKQINIIRNTLGTRNWQRDFHDSVIRNNNSYHRIKNYIINNPQNWDENKFR